MRRALKYFFCFVLAVAFARAQDKRVADEGLRNALFSWQAVNLRTGAIISASNSALGLTPASTIKLLTTGAALKVLGSDFRFKTHLCHTGTFEKASGVIKGDLVIVGNGDPSLQADQFYKEKITEQWAKDLHAAGVRSISGNVVGDASFYKAVVPGTWQWEDVNNYYGAVPSGLNYLENKFSVLFNTGPTGSQASVSAVAPAYSSKTLNLISEVQAHGKDDQAYFFGDPLSFEKRIKGSLPPNKKNYSVEGVLPDAALLLAEHLKDALKKKGILSGRALSITDRAESPAVEGTLLTWQSPPLSEIIYFTNQASNNFFCEALLFQLGKGFREEGIRKVKTVWHNAGLDSGEVFLKDGCGLARADFVTTRYLTGLLALIYADTAMYGVINRSLPVAGKQGSMVQVGKGTPLENNLRAKTGYMLKVRSYAGYLRCKSGDEVAFCAILNNYGCTAAEARSRIQELLLTIYNQN